MAVSDVVAYNPQGMEFLPWARLLVEGLAEYNVPSPVSEGLWNEWAEFFASTPELAQLGVPNPQGFSDWRTWATSVTQVIG